MSDKLARLVQRVQAEARVPALSAALHRADRPLWQAQAGAAEAESQFRIGSVTKTFTAVLVLQARDDGLLDLDDPIGRHLDLPAHGDLPVRRLLSHTSGLQREPYGDVWDTLLAPDADRLLTELDRAERVLPPARRYHYSTSACRCSGTRSAGCAAAPGPRCSTTASCARSACPRRRSSAPSGR
jgi:CubicO group peptidase (beta-lactamase class C family)